MRAMTSLLVMLLLAVAGCSKTDNSADRNAADQATSGAADQDTATDAPGTTTTFEGEPPPPPTEEPQSPNQ